MTTVVDMDGGTTVIASLGDTGTVFVSTPMGGGSAGGASIMADISDKQGKVLDDLIEIADYAASIDGLTTPGGYIVKVDLGVNGLLSGASVLVAENAGYVTQALVSAVSGEVIVRYYDPSTLSWSSWVNTVTARAVSDWYSDTTAAAADAVINADGSFSREVSTEEFKRDIEPMLDAHADDILAGLEPMWYRSTCERDNKEWSFWGLSAEHTATIDPRLVHWGHSTKEVPQPFGEPKTVPDLDSPLKPIGVQYSRLVVPLLQVAKRQGAAISALESRIAALEAKP